MSTIKTLTLTQPYASLMAIGAKKVETRGWYPSSLRSGQRIAIHAAKGFGDGDAETFCKQCGEEPFKSALVAGFRAGYFTSSRPPGFYPGDLPRGAVVAIARFVKAIRGDAPKIERLSEQERAFGFYGPGRWAWVFEDVRAIEPIPARGQLYLWNWTPPDWLTYLDPAQVLAARAAQQQEMNHGA